MKIRAGFVSNSSSSSFILSISSGLDKIIEYVKQGYESSTFNRDTILDNLRKEHGTAKKDLKNYLGNKTNNSKKNMALHDLCASMCAGKVGTINKMIKLIESKETGWELEYMEYLGMHMIDDGEQTKFVASTSMYNDLSDIPQVMRDVMVALSMNKVRYTIDVENDV